MPQGAVYVIRTQIAPEKEAEWDAWHRESHVPEVLAEAGFRRAQRLRMVEGDDPHRYWTVYDLESVQALKEFRQRPASVRLAADHQQRYGSVSDLQRSIFEVLDDVRAPLAPSEVAAVGDHLSVLLRPARGADEAAVLLLLQQSYPDDRARATLSEEEARTSFRQYLADPDAGLFVAEVAGRVVAFASATTYPTMRFGRRGHIEDLCVEPSSRRSGVAHRLLDYVERWARREGVTHLSTVIGMHREESRRFLTKEGFADASLALRKHWEARPPGPSS